jgi:hypothetical protein
MLSMVLLALAAPTAAASPAASPPRAVPCRMPGLTYADKDKRIVQPKKLGDQPPASQYLAVARHVGGCQAPAIVRTGIGLK